VTLHAKNIWHSHGGHCPPLWQPAHSFTVLCRMGQTHPVNKIHEGYACHAYCSKALAWSMRSGYISCILYHVSCQSHHLSRRNAETSVVHCTAHFPVLKVTQKCCPVSHTTSHLIDTHAAFDRKSKLPRHAAEPWWSTNGGNTHELQQTNTQAVHFTLPRTQPAKARARSQCQNRASDVHRRRQEHQGRKLYDQTA
jgi:hypothetical protein